MPFKSKAQRRKFAELLIKGEISPETYEEWNRETGSAKLPERVDRKAGKTPKRKARIKRISKQSSSPSSTSKGRRLKTKTRSKAAKPRG